jgi:hypothetical protein
MTAFWYRLWGRVVLLKYTDVSEVRTASIIRDPRYSSLSSILSLPLSSIQILSPAACLEQKVNCM